MRQSGQNKQIIIEILFQILDPVEKENPYKGLVNEGTTCYLNSLIQTLFFIRAFRNAIYQMPTLNNNDDETKSIPFNL